MGTVHSRARASTQHPTLQQFVDWLALRVPFDLYIYEAERSVERSRYLYEQGRTRDGAIVSNAKGLDDDGTVIGDSPHNWRLAFDVYPMDAAGVSITKSDAPEFQTLGQAARGFEGVTWGGSFVVGAGGVDMPHFELRDWRTQKNWDGKGAVTEENVFKPAPDASLPSGWIPPGSSADDDVADASTKPGGGTLVAGVLLAIGVGVAYLSGFFRS